jgi:hypothetical protein
MDDRDVLGTDSGDMWAGAAATNRSASVAALLIVFGASPPAVS